MKKSEYLDSGNYGLVSGTDFKNGFIDWETCSFVSEWRYNQDRNIQLRNGDVLITKDGTIGKVAYVQGMTCPTTLNSGIFVIRPATAELQPSFLQLIFKSRFFLEFLDRITAGSTIVHLYQKDIVEFDFPIPNILEQLRIAHTIEIVDQHLSEIKHLIVKYEALKKATVNLLLKPKEGWVHGKLSDVCENFTGLTYTPEDVSDNGTLVLRSSNIQNDSLSFADNVRVVCPIPKHAMVKVGDLLVCVRNGSRNLIGKSAIISPEAQGMAFGAFMTVLRATVLNQQFLSYLWQSSMIQEQIEESLGATINQITNADIKRFEVYYPASFDEQRVIAERISAIDEVLVGCKVHLAKARQLKLGMMSYFFG